MNLELKKILEKENNDELFFRFKHDGAMNFEKKLISGKILRERRFDKSKLKAEKNLTIREIHNSISKYANSSNFEEEKKRKIKETILFNTLFIAATSTYYFFFQKGSVDSITILGIILTTGFILYSIFAIPKQMQKALVLAQEDRKQLELRLKLIEKEWIF